MYLGIPSLGLVWRLGGSSTPPGEFDAGMRTAINLGGITPYTGAFPFANLFSNMGNWDLMSGTADFTQDQGEFTVSSVTGTAILRNNNMVDPGGYGLIAGTYTLKNPNGYNIAIKNTAQTVTYLDYSTTTADRTFSWPGGGSTVDGMIVLIEVTAPGTYTGFALIQPNCPNYPTDIFNSAFISYLEGLHLPYLRFMDWNDTNSNIDTDWADRTVTGKPSYRNEAAYGNACAPYEVQIALCNRMGADMWVNIPVRATDAYVTSLATLIEAELDPELNVYVEYGNESWNSTGVFGAGYSWVMLRNHTKYTATVNPATKVLTYAGHGMTTGDAVHGWVHRSSRIAGVVDGVDEGGLTPYYWEQCWGRQFIVNVLSADTFELHSGSSGGPLVGWPVDVTQWVFCKRNEIVIATADEHTVMNTNYGEACGEVWALFDAVMDPARVKAVCSAWTSQSNTAAQRLAVFECVSRADHLAIAPYNFPTFWGGRVSVSSNTFTPKCWTTDTSSGHTYVGVYAQGSTPTNQEVIDGTGTGYVDSTDFSTTYAASTYTTGSGLTVVNGTTYTVIMLYKDRRDYYWRVEEDIAASAVASDVDFLDTYANQNLRQWTDLEITTFPQIQAHLNVIANTAYPDITLVGYEGGMHIDGQTAPYPELHNWFWGYTESPECGEFQDRYMRNMAALGMVAYAHFGDAQDYASPSFSWRIANSYQDTADYRYQAIAAFNGGVPIETRIGGATIRAATLYAAPTLPHTLHTFTQPGTYTILKGNNVGNYEIVGLELRLIATTDFDWVNPSSQRITIHVTDGDTDDVRDVVFSIGDSWYEGDDIFALDMTVQADASSLTPAIGSALPRTGSGGSFTDDMLDCEATASYYNVDGMAEIPTTSMPLFFAVVAKKDDLATAYQDLVYFGTGVFVGLMSKPGNTHIFWRYFTGSADQLDENATDTPWEDAKHVFWLFFDPPNNKYYYGRDQTDETAGAGVAFSSWRDFTNKAVTLSATQEEKGSMKVSNREDLDLTTCLSMVAEMQTLHSIA